MGINARTRRRADSPKATVTPAHARTPSRALADRVTHARSIPPRGVLGDGTLLVALAAGFGGAFACLLVVVVVGFILRNRRSTLAADPAPALLYVS